MIALAIILTGIGSYTLRAFFIFALSRYTFPPLLLTGTGICRAHRHGSLGHLHAHHTRGRIGCGHTRGRAICAALVAKVTGNHILSLTAGMASFWLLGWLL